MLYSHRLLAHTNGVFPSGFATTDICRVIFEIEQKCSGKNFYPLCRKQLILHGGVKSVTLFWTSEEFLFYSVTHWVTWLVHYFCSKIHVQSRDIFVFLTQLWTKEGQTKTIDKFPQMTFFNRISRRWVNTIREFLGTFFTDPSQLQSLVARITRRQRMWRHN